MIPCSEKEHPRKGFSTVATVTVIMRACIYAVEGKRSIHMPVNGLQRVCQKLSSRNVRLVGHDDESVSGVAQQPQCINDSGNELEFIDRPRRPVFPVLENRPIDDTVAVQKNRGVRHFGSCRPDRMLPCDEAPHGTIRHEGSYCMERRCRRLPLPSSPHRRIR